MTAVKIEHSVVEAQTFCIVMWKKLFYELLLHVC